MNPANLKAYRALFSYDKTNIISNYNLEDCDFITTNLKRYTVFQVDEKYSTLRICKKKYCRKNKKFYGASHFLFIICERVFLIPASIFFRDIEKSEVETILGSYYDVNVEHIIQNKNTLII